MIVVTGPTGAPVEPSQQHAIPHPDVWPAPLRRGRTLSLQDPETGRHHTWVVRSVDYAEDAATATAEIFSPTLPASHPGWRVPLAVVLALLEPRRERHGGTPDDTR